MSQLAVSTPAGDCTLADDRNNGDSTYRSAPASVLALPAPLAENDVTVKTGGWLPAGRGAGGAAEALDGRDGTGGVPGPRPWPAVSLSEGLTAGQGRGPGTP